MRPIKKFRGPYGFLSNFHDCPVEWEGIRYPTTEHAFQAAKTVDDMERNYIANLATPRDAKEAGRRVTLRPYWDDIKDDIMYEICLIKFNNAEMRERLLATGDAYLEEGNTWGDVYWGTQDGVGENKLGKILMRIRRRIAADSNPKLW